MLKSTISKRKKESNLNVVFSLIVAGDREAAFSSLLSMLRDLSGTVLIPKNTRRDSLELLEDLAKVAL